MKNQQSQCGAEHEKAQILYDGSYFQTITKMNITLQVDTEDDGYEVGPY